MADKSDDVESTVRASRRALHTRRCMSAAPLPRVRGDPPPDVSERGAVAREWMISRSPGACHRRSSPVLAVGGNGPFGSSSPRQDVRRPRVYRVSISGSSPPPGSRDAKDTAWPMVTCPPAMWRNRRLPAGKCGTLPCALPYVAPVGQTAHQSVKCRCDPCRRQHEGNLVGSEQPSPLPASSPAT